MDNYKRNIHKLAHSLIRDLFNLIRGSQGG